MHKRSYKKFCSDSSVDVKNICWSVVCNEEQPDTALDAFMKLFIPVTNKQTPFKKMTVKTVKSPWIDEELKNFMIERDEAKVSGSPTDCQTYCKLRNHETKLKKKKKKLHYETKINYTKNDRKKLWSTLNYILGNVIVIESDGSFITRPTDIANYFNYFFIGKISKLRDDMQATNSDTTYQRITDQY